MTDTTSNTNRSVLLYAFITVILWASAFVFTKVALVNFTPESLGAVRYLFASILLIVFSSLLKKLSLPSIKDIPIFFLAGFTGFSFYIYAFNKGSVSLNASTSSILISTVPIITAVLAMIFYKEKINKICWFAIAIEFSGIIIIAVNNGVFAINRGVNWMLGAALSFAIYNMLQRKILKKYTSLQSTTYSIFAGTILLGSFFERWVNTII